jgi:hypothetical protein
MHLTGQQRRWLDGEGGSALQWAMQFNESLGQFYDAERLLPVGSAHFAPDTRMAGAAGLALLETLASDGARIRVPGYLDPCLVDFARAAKLVATYGLTEDFVAADRKTMALCRTLGFLPTYSCINYQTVTPPRFAEHLAWGDTGAAISANSIFGARTNFEGGPSALASALIGATPAYGLHLPQNRCANLLLRLDCRPEEIADWGAIAVWAGAISPGYETVPVLHGDFAPPGFNMLKQLGVALASYGGHAMFHLVGATPEAPTLESACGGVLPGAEQVMSETDLQAIYEHRSLHGNDVDLVVFAAPQLAIDELAEIVALLDGRRVHANTQLIVAIDPQVCAQAHNAGLKARAEALGVEFTTGTCFYGEAPLMQAARGWRSVVTNSAKLVNTLAATGLDVALRRLHLCLDAAVTGRLTV